MQRPENLVWIDLEMTGLDPARHVILEIACLVTNADLEVLEEGTVIAIQRTEAELVEMDDWNARTHTASGLLERVRGTSVVLSEAEQRVLAYVQRWVPEGASPLCGNSIHQDRRFLRREMPAFEAYLHYRNVDVSTIKEIVRRWYPTSRQAPPKQEMHSALEDVRESIAELRWYREHIFVPVDGEVAGERSRPN